MAQGNAERGDDPFLFFSARFSNSFEEGRVFTHSHLFIFSIEAWIIPYSVLLGFVSTGILTQ